MFTPSYQSLRFDLVRRSSRKIIMGIGICQNVYSDPHKLKILESMKVIFLLPFFECIDAALKDVTNMLSNA